MIQRKCTGPCGRTLDLQRGNFGVNKNYKGGFMPMCLKCRREYTRTKRLETRSTAPDPILAHSPFRSGDICDVRGLLVRVSHGMQHDSSTRIAVYEVESGRKRMFRFREFVAFAKKVESAPVTPDAELRAG